MQDATPVVFATIGVAPKLVARSFLFVPGDRPDRFEKAWESAADDLILDLEDAVRPEMKDLARDTVSKWMSCERPVWVRCNAVDSPWFHDDLQLAKQPGCAGLILPKAETAPPSFVEMARVDGFRWIPLIETAQGFKNAEELARSEGVVRLAFGALDFQFDLGIEGDDDGLAYFRSQLVLASRLAGVASPIDGVTPSVHDELAVRRDTLRARRFGMGAKLCIHPCQIPWVHEALAPNNAERAWAALVVDAMTSAQGAAVAIDGKMVDRPVWLRAQRIHGAPQPSARVRPQTGTN